MMVASCYSCALKKYSRKEKKNSETLTYANQDDDSLEMIVNSLVTFYHTTFLSVCVAVLGTDATNYVCVALDFLCNLLLLYR